MKKLRITTLTWLILLLTVGIGLYQLYRFPLLPSGWKLAATFGYGLILLVCGALSFVRSRKLKYVGSAINCMFAFMFCIVAVVMSFIGKNIRQSFTTMPDTFAMQVNVYALKTEESINASLMDYRDGVFISQSSVDQDNQSEALRMLNEMFGKDIAKIEKETIWEAINALYNHEGQVLILNSNYVPIIVENTEYKTFEDDVVLLHTFTREVSIEIEEPEVSIEDIPTNTFSVFVAGADDSETLLPVKSRTDVDIVATIDPDHKTIALVSFPRDYYIPNPYLNGGLDKLTHMSIYGLGNTAKALSDILNIPVNNYIMVNFFAFTRVVDSLGGITISNPYAFQSGRYSFPEGEITLTGEEALVYVRTRQTLADGDFGRNRHQVIVLKALIQKILSAESIVTYKNLMESLQGTFQTNMGIDWIFDLLSEQLGSSGAWQIIMYSLQGATGEEFCASMPGIFLSVVYPNEEQIEFVSEQMKKMYRNEEIVQLTMP